MHSHILPGIDDGASTLDDSVALVRELVDGGVTEIVATPHYIDETIYVSPKKTNAELLKKLKTRLSKEGIKVKIRLGNEIYICPKILDLVKKGEIATVGGKKKASGYLLVELPMSGEYPGYEDIFLQLLRAGYKVVLAHPERYTAFQKDFALISRLCEMGVVLQCNLGSFLGQYGKSAMKTATRLAKSKMIWALGSDIHHPHGTSFVPDAVEKISRYYTDDELAEILVGNPGKM